MIVYGLVVAVCYLTLQLSVLFWRATRWRTAGQTPLWLLGGATIVAVVLGAFGVPYASMLMWLSLPVMTAYLACLWAAYVLAHRTSPEV